MFIFAQANPTPDQLAAWISVLFYLGGFACTVIGCWVGIRSLRKEDAAPTPQPLVVTAHKSYTPWESHLELKARVDKMSDEIRQGFERLDHKRSVSIAGLHDDLQSTSAAIRAEMKEDMSGVHNRITEVLSAVTELRGEFRGSRK